MKSALVLVLLCLGSATLWADTAVSRRDNLIQIQKILEQELSGILQSWDTRAIITARVYERSETLPVPSTPFVMPNVSIRDVEDNPVIDHVLITILSTRSALPKSLEKVLRDTAQGYGRVDLQFKTIGSELQSELAPGSQSREELVKALENEKNKAAATQASKAELEKKVSWQELAKVFVGLLPGLLIFSSVVLLVRELRKGFAILAKSFVGKESSAPNQSQNAARPSNAAVATRVQGGSGDSEKSSISKLPLESVKELFGDAYWGEFDTYAAYIWHRLTLETRRAIIESVDWASSYVASLASREEENLGCEDEPYYLKPFALSHLNNEVLSEIVRKNPVLLDRISSLRAKQLSMGALERIGIMKLGKSDKQTDLVDFTGFPASQPRKVANIRLMPIKTIEEEEEILKLENVTPEIMELIPSLGWLMELSDGEISKILSRFNPEDLASAWIGPKSVLDRLAICLPEKKRSWVASFSKNNLADRASPTFVELHALGVEAHRRKARDSLNTESVAA